MNDGKESDNDINGYDYAHDDNGVPEHRTGIGVDPIDDDNADGADDDEATSDDDDDDDDGEQNIEATVAPAQLGQSRLPRPHGPPSRY